MQQEHKIDLFRALFKGREDVFATRWEKSGKSSYAPVCQYDHHYQMHLMNGGTSQNYPHKSCIQLSDNEIQKHLSGVRQIGIYPLLPDGTSWVFGC